MSPQETSNAAFNINAFYNRLGFPETSLLDKRIYKRMVLEHGDLTAADKKTLSEDVTKLTWKSNCITMTITCGRKNTEKALSG